MSIYHAEPFLALLLLNKCMIRMLRYRRIFSFFLQFLEWMLKKKKKKWVSFILDLLFIFEAKLLAQCCQEFVKFSSIEHGLFLYFFFFFLCVCCLFFNQFHSWWFLFKLYLRYYSELIFSVLESVRWVMFAIILIISEMFGIEGRSSISFSIIKLYKTANIHK